MLLPIAPPASAPAVAPRIAPAIGSPWWLLFASTPPAMAPIVPPATAPLWVLGPVPTQPVSSALNETAAMRRVDLFTAVRKGAMRVEAVTSADGRGDSADNRDIHSRNRSRSRSSTTPADTRREDSNRDRSRVVARSDK